MPARQSPPRTYGRFLELMPGRHKLERRRYTVKIRTPPPGPAAGRAPRSLSGGSSYGETNAIGAERRHRVARGLASPRRATRVGRWFGRARFGVDLVEHRPGLGSGRAR